MSAENTSAEYVEDIEESSGWDRIIIGLMFLTPLFLVPVLTFIFMG